MPNAYRRAHQIDRRKLLKISGALGTLSLTGLAVAGNMPTSFPMIHLPLPVEHLPEEVIGAIIKLVGVGPSGQNAVEYMVERGVQGIEFVSAGSNAASIRRNKASKVIQFGREGDIPGNHRVREREAAELIAGDIRAAIHGAHMLFIAVCVDSHIDAGAAMAIARIARKMGILTVGVVTKPLEWKTCRRMGSSEAELAELRTHVDSLLVLHDDKLQSVPGNQHWTNANDLLKIAVSGFAEMINVQGSVNVDFEDVRIIMDQPGKAIMGTAQASGPDRARLAADQALACPSIQGMGLSGAQGVLVMVATSKSSLKLFESRLAINTIRASVSLQAHIIYGNIYDEALGDEMRIIVVAAGIPDAYEEKARA